MYQLFHLVIFLRGQGIKIFSLVVNECAENGFVLPTLEKIDPNELTELEKENMEIFGSTELEEEESEVPDSERYKVMRENNVKYDDLIDEESNNNRTKKNNEDLDISNLSNNDDIFQLKSDFNVIKMTEDSYEGAIVLVPKPNIYFEPVTVLDFSSLYPSEMIASDLSHDRIVEDDCWLGDEGKLRLQELGYDVLDRTYDNFSWVDNNNKSKGKLKNGEITIRFVQYRDGRKGLIPRILQKLLGARKATKKE